MRLPRRALPALLALAAAAAGCGPTELPKRSLAPTRGTLRLNGEPVKFASVEFLPEDPTVGLKADGNTDANGAFELRTYSNGDPDGAVPGTYRVEVGPYNGGRIPAGEKPTVVPEGSRKAEATVEVTSGDNELTIDLPGEK